MTRPDPATLRKAFGRFMTGVTVVTTLDRDGAPTGFTANSFSSVSLDPPLLLVCPGKFLSSYNSFATCKHFAINILAEGQEAVSNTFATFKGDRFSQVAHSPNAQGIPLIDDALAQFSCATHQVVPAGDHCILIGEVLEVTQADGRGLGYADGQYFSLGLEREALDQPSGPVVCGAIIEQDGHVLLERTADGLRPPQITHSERGNLRTDLTDHLTAQGITATLGAAYSVYLDAQRQHAYFLATADSPRDACELVAIPIPDLPSQTYTRTPIAEMMARFAIEYRNRTFALYVGDAHGGDVHTLQKGR